MLLEQLKDRSGEELQVASHVMWLGLLLTLAIVSIYIVVRQTKRVNIVTRFSKENNNTLH